MEIMISDLTPKKQKEVLDYLGLKHPKDGHYDVLPLFMIADITRLNDGTETYDRVAISMLLKK